MLHKAAGADSGTKADLSTVTNIKELLITTYPPSLIAESHPKSASEAGWCPRRNCKRRRNRRRRRNHRRSRTPGGCSVRLQISPHRPASPRSMLSMAERRRAKRRRSRLPARVGTVSAGQLSADDGPAAGRRRAELRRQRRAERGRIVRGGRGSPPLRREEGSEIVGRRGDRPMVRRRILATPSRSPNGPGSEHGRYGAPGTCRRRQGQVRPGAPGNVRVHQRTPVTQDRYRVNNEQRRQLNSELHIIRCIQNYTGPRFRKRERSLHPV